MAGTLIKKDGGGQRDGQALMWLVKLHKRLLYCMYSTIHANTYMTAPTAIPRRRGV
jgi:hypothetical protein